jgi:hypothetical protein
MRTASAVALGLLLACSGTQESYEAGPGGNNEGCEQPGSHSYELSDHSCACEDGYAWCSTALDDFDCCPIDGSEDTGEPATEPDLPCDEALAEQLVCVADVMAPEDPGGSVVWACNGEHWVEVPGYATFECLADGYPFAYGCLAGDSAPTFLCGYGQGSDCDATQFASLCVDEDIIDTCVWGRRTVDRCSRLCAELEVFGPGFTGGVCLQPDPEMPAACECCVTC